MYVWLCRNVSMYLPTYMCIYLCMYVCNYARMYYVYMHECMCVCACNYVNLHIFIYNTKLIWQSKIMEESCRSLATREPLLELDLTYEPVLHRSHCNI